MAPATVAQAIERVLTAYADLTALGEEIEDEWSYVNDLATAWRERLEAVADGDRDKVLGDDVEAAIDRAIDEIDRITDPHRAIDWLSTFPQVTLLAFGEAA